MVSNNNGKAEYCLDSEIKNQLEHNNLNKNLQNNITY